MLISAYRTITANPNVPFRGIKLQHNYLIYLVPVAGFEPATY